MTVGQVMSPLAEVVINLKTEVERKKELNHMMMVQLSKLSYLPDGVKKNIDTCNYEQDGEKLPSTIQTDLSDIHFDLARQNNMQMALLEVFSEILEGKTPIDPSAKVMRGNG